MVIKTREELLAEREALQAREEQIYNEMLEANSVGLDTLMRERRANLKRQCEIIDELLELNVTHERIHGKAGA